MSACSCPPGSAGYLSAEHSDAGSVVSSHGVDFYKTGAPHGEHAKVIIFISDIWGWNGGRTRLIADLLASDGYAVLVPKLLEPLEGGTDGDGLPPSFDLGERGQELGPWLKRQHWEGPIRQKIEGVLAYAQEHYPGVAISAVGVCWGGCMAFHLAGIYPSLRSIVVPHPSIHLEGAMYGGSNHDLAAAVHCPVLLMPAHADPHMYREDGELFRAVHSNNHASRTVLFDHMQHGWVTRGDLSDAKVKHDYEHAIDLMRSFFKAH